LTIDPFDWRGRTVLVTGHTGFKGSWLALWLHRLGATVTGFSNEVPTDPSHFEAVGLGDLVDDRRGDIRDAAAVDAVVSHVKPELVFHLAAQPLVRRSYVDPVGTLSANVMGSAHVLESCRQHGVGGVVVATTDKCYVNREWAWGYREDDALGGDDPYSASKAATEMVAATYRASFPELRVASVRAGNVIGPGDWAADRLVPDAVRAVASGSQLVVRNPRSVRPWQDVLDCLVGYLLVGRGLLDNADTATAWNFGPTPGTSPMVGEMVALLSQAWQGKLRWNHEADGGPPEYGTLAVDATRARQTLGWSPACSLTDTLQAIVSWHDAAARGVDMRDVSLARLAFFESAWAAHSSVST
jgi:CDP-glucose 4,6-dehydratase